MLIRAPILNPRLDGTVQFLEDGALAVDEHARIKFVGRWNELPVEQRYVAPTDHVTRGIILPPFLDNHIHIPQHPIRGRFMDGVEANPPGGRLIAGLNRNVFPAEQRCEHPDVTARVVREFLKDTLSYGVVGGAAYMTVHATATTTALQMLPPLWHVGLVMMNQYCPEYLRTDEPNLQRDVEALAEGFGSRFILTDRFAVAVDSQLRRRAVELSRELGLRMQTHLNEQVREKNFVELRLYPAGVADNYTDVYRRDGLLERRPILAHCIHMGSAEWEMLKGTGSAVAHCPTSNTLLASGVMNLDALVETGLPWSICTDVGASPSTSLLNEMAQFLKVHWGRSRHAKPQVALFRTTLGAAEMLGVENTVGTFGVGRPLSFIEVACEPEKLRGNAVDDVIVEALLDTSIAELDRFAHTPECARALDALAAGGLDIGRELDCLTNDVATTVAAIERKVSRVVLDGRTVWERPAAV
jgi:guanine deaminase